MDAEDKKTYNPPREPSTIGSDLKSATTAQPSVISTMDRPSATTQIEQKEDPGNLEKKISEELRGKDVEDPGTNGQNSNSDKRTIEGVGTRKGSADDKATGIFHLPEREEGIDSSSEPSVIPESQETVSFFRNEGVSNSKESDINSGSTVRMEETTIGGLIADDIEEEFKEVTLERGIVQMRIQGDGNPMEADDADSEVIRVVDNMVRTVDDQLEGSRITSLVERSGIKEQRTNKLAESTGTVTKTPQDVHVSEGVPMEVDSLPTANGKGDERTKENAISVGEIAEEPITDGVSTTDKIEEDIDPSWKTEDFDLPPSDEEGDIPSEPPPHVIVELYQRLEREKVLDLEWSCLGRRTPDHDLEEMVVEESEKEDKDEELDQPVEENPTEFDFDIDSVIQNKVTPRRTPGFEPKGSGSAKKRVANMDKVIGDIIRFSKIDEEMEKTGDTASSTAPADLEVTPQRPLGKFHIRRDLHQ